MAEIYKLISSRDHSKSTWWRYWQTILFEQPPARRLPTTVTDEIGLSSHTVCTETECDDSSDFASSKLRPTKSAPARLQRFAISLPLLQDQALEEPSHAKDTERQSKRSFPLRTQKRITEDMHRACPHVLRTSFLSGNLEWCLDSVNIAIARRSCESLKAQHFANDLEYKKFLSNPVTLFANLQALCGDRWTLDAQQLLLAREMEIIEKLPSISEGHINDLNKGDIFVKILAIFQISWLCIQLIVRRAHGIPTTQIEVLALAFTLCSIITYCLLYNRPKDVQTVRELIAVRYPTPEELTRIANVGPRAYGWHRQSVAIPNNVVHWSRTAHRTYVWAASVSAVVIFGSPHFIAWNAEFPSPVEKILWRASTIATVTVFPALMWPVAIRLLSKMFGLDRLQRRLDQPSGRFIRVIGVLAIGVFWPMFIAARIFIVVEALRSLAHQPSEAFRSTWGANIPHAG